MAAVYSLVCWGGRTGKTVTLSIASPCVVTSTSHGLRGGTRLVFSTTGALPTGITAGTTYYAKSTAANTFNLYSDAALTSIVNTSGTQSGTHTAKSVLMGEYFSQYSGRWGESGSERCYDGLASWNTARGSASPLDMEVAEIGEAFSEIRTATCEITVPSGIVTVVTTINGVRSPGFHNGNIPTATPTLAHGYVYHYQVSGQGTALGFGRDSVTIDGFSVYLSGDGYSPSGVGVGATAVRCAVSNMISIGRNDGYGGGFGISGQGTIFSNNIATKWGVGFQAYQYCYGTVCANCLSVGNTVGFGGQPASMYGTFYNNISIGNTTNWGSAALGSTLSTNNAGLSGEAWMNGTGASRVTMATSDFANYAAGDYRPASSTSPQVDAGTILPYALLYDIANDERPNYNNGGSEAFDVGPYEYDHGYGDHPATATISLSNIVSGSRVLITRDDTSAVLYNDVPGASLSLSTGYIGNFSIVIRKASESPYYREFSAGGTTVANQTTSIKALQQLDE